MRFITLLVAELCSVASFAQITDRPAAEPNKSYYSPAEIEKFVSFTRDTYTAAFGQQADPYDPSRPVKQWVDQSVDLTDPHAAYTFRYVGKDKQGNPAFLTYTTTRLEASRVNLPGVYGYVKYDVAATPAVIRTPNGTVTALNPYNFCTLAEAEALNRDLNGDNPPPVVENPIVDGKFFQILWNGETRRDYLVSYRGVPGFRAAVLLFEKNQHGIGAPGHWDLDSDSPFWKSERQVTGEYKSLPTVPAPVRPLFDDEDLVSVGFGIVEVHRKGH
jgi:hypothetical protein